MKGTQRKGDPRACRKLSVHALTHRPRSIIRRAEGVTLLTKEDASHQFNAIGNAGDGIHQGAEHVPADLLGGLRCESGGADTGSDQRQEQNTEE